MPLLSIVVPTLARADTLKSALATLAIQTTRDCEFIVQNTGADRETEEVTMALGDPRVKHFATERIETMTDNWELALAHASGDYLTFIGDDDGFLPDGCQIAAAVLGREHPEILSWRPYAYYWPQYYNRSMQNRISATVDFEFTAEPIDSYDTLRSVYRMQLDYASLPMLYNSFVRRDVVERVVTKAGRYFLGNSPDVVSGIANAAVARSFLRLSRPLTISGLSQHSTGHTNFMAGSRELEAAEGVRDFGRIAKDPRLPSLDLLQTFIANDMLAMKARLFADDAGLSLDFRALAQSIATNVNLRPASYERALETIAELASLHGFDARSIAVPAKSQARPAEHARGATPLGDGRVHFEIDGATLGLANVADAAALVGEIIPGSSSEIRWLAAKPTDVPVLGAQGLTFGRRGNGSSALVEGWSEVEEWGTWSVAKTCSIRFSLGDAAARPLRIAIGSRQFVTASHLRLVVRCLVNGRAAAECVFAFGEPAEPMEIVLERGALRHDGLVDLTFELTEPRSPADLNISSDVRPLGIGLEWMRISGEASE